MNAALSKFRFPRPAYLLLCKFNRNNFKYGYVSYVSRFSTASNSQVQEKYFPLISPSVWTSSIIFFRKMTILRETRAFSIKFWNLWGNLLMFITFYYLLLPADIRYTGQFTFKSAKLLLHNCKNQADNQLWYSRKFLQQCTEYFNLIDCYLCE